MTQIPGEPYPSVLELPLKRFLAGPSAPAVEVMPAVLQAGETFVLPVQIQDSWEPAVPGGGRLVMLSRVTGVGKESVHLEGANGNGLPRSVTC